MRAEQASRIRVKAAHVEAEPVKAAQAEAEPFVAEPVVIDHLAFPHIFDTIIALADETRTARTCRGKRCCAT